MNHWPLDYKARALPLHHGWLTAILLSCIRPLWLKESWCCCSQQKCRFSRPLTLCLLEEIDVRFIIKLNGWLSISFPEFRWRKKEELILDFNHQSNRHWWFIKYFIPLDHWFRLQMNVKIWVLLQKMKSKKGKEILSCCIILSSFMKSCTKTRIIDRPSGPVCRPVCSLFKYCYITGETIFPKNNGMVSWRKKGLLHSNKVKLYLDSNVLVSIRFSVRPKPLEKSSYQ